MENNKIKTFLKEYPMTTAVIVIGIIVLISVLLVESGQISATTLKSTLKPLLLILKAL